MRKLLFAMVGSALMACTNISSSNAENVTSVRHIDNYTGIDAGQGIKVNVVAGWLFRQPDSVRTCRHHRQNCYRSKE